MTAHHVRVMPAAARHLAAIEARIALEANTATAEAYVQAVLERCFALDTFPHQGTARNDMRSGVRTFSFRRNVVIAYAVEGDEVAILAVAWRGQQLAGLLTEDDR